MPLSSGQIGRHPNLADISEWQPLQWHQSQARAMLASIVLVVCVAMSGRRRVRFSNCTITGAGKVGVLLEKNAAPQLVDSIIWGSPLAVKLGSGQPPCVHCCLQGGVPEGGDGGGGNLAAEPRLRGVGGGRVLLGGSAGGAGAGGGGVGEFGCGGVGDAAIAGARLAGAHTIIGVDIDDRKLEWAKEFGATHTINASQTDPVEAIRKLTGGNGVNVAIEAVGRPITYEQAFYARDHAGTLVQVGVPSPDMKIELPLIELFGRGGSLKSSWYGDCLPSRDFPMYIDLYLQGRLDLDRFVSETIPLDGVEDAFHKMERGEVLRSVVVF